MAKLTHIAIHHFGGTSDPYASTQGQSEALIDRVHKNNGFTRSSTGDYIGYNAIIWPKGEIKWYHPLGEQTCAQKLANKTAVSICLAGNFTKRPDGSPVDVPTIAQRQTLQTALVNLIKNPQMYPHIQGTEFALNAGTIWPHRRFYGNSTSCYGTALLDNWATDLTSDIREIKISSLQSLLNLYRSFLDHLIRRGRLQGDDLDCQGHL